MREQLLAEDLSQFPSRERSRVGSKNTDFKIIDEQTLELIADLAARAEADSTKRADLWTQIISDLEKIVAALTDVIEIGPQCDLTGLKCDRGVIDATLNRINQIGQDINEVVRFNRDNPTTPRRRITGEIVEDICDNQKLIFISKNCLESSACSFQTTKTIIDRVNDG